MDSFIHWCNDNSAFIEIILSIAPIFISVVAIIISIHLGRLPYRKNIKLVCTICYASGEGLAEPIITDIGVSACNTGNRNVRIKFLGFAVEKKDKNSPGDYLLLFNNKHRTNGQRQELKPTDVLDIEYPVEQTVQSLIRLDQNLKMYLYFEDTEGKRWVKKYKTVGAFLSQLT